MSMDNFENLLYDSRSSDGKESLLRKCRDTIEVIEIELEQERAAKQDSERHNRELLRSIEIFKGETEDLETKNDALRFENQEHSETIEFLQSKIFKLNDELDKSNSFLEKERKRLKAAYLDIEKIQEINEDLKEEINSKQIVIDE